MDAVDAGKALSNNTRVRLLQILSDESLSATEAKEKHNTRFDEDTRRESIYRELEKLVELGFLNKDYDSEEKSLVYTLRFDSITVYLDSGEVSEDTVND